MTPKSSVTELLMPPHGMSLPRKTSKNALSVFGHFQWILYQGTLLADEVSPKCRYDPNGVAISGSDTGKSTSKMLKAFLACFVTVATPPMPAKSSVTKLQRHGELL